MEKGLESVEKKLRMPKEKCGMGVPSIYMYYLAFNARYPLTWGYCENNTTMPGSWEWTEKCVLKEYNKTISLKSLWYNPKFQAKSKNVRLQKQYISS